MRPIEDMQFTADATRDGKFIGRVREFRDLRSNPKSSRLDAIDEIITLTSERIREIDGSR